MPTVRVIPVATTTAGTPRSSSTVDYDGTSDKTVKVQFVCPTWATADPTPTVDLAIQQSFDNGQTWADFARLSAHPRSVSRTTGELPSMTVQVTDGLGLRKVRAVLSISAGSLDIGVDATV